MIFILSGRWSYDTPKCELPVVARVCSYWRDIALDCSDLWTELCACILRHERIQLWLQTQAKRKPFRMFYAVHGASAMELEDCIRIAMKNVGQLDLDIRGDAILRLAHRGHRGLYRATEMHKYAVENVLSTELQQTRVINVRWSVDNTSVLPPEIDTAFFDAPMLRSLSIDGIALAHDGVQIAPFPMLTSIIDMHEFSHLISHCPALQTLILDNALAWLRGRADTTSIATLSSLRELYICHHAHFLAHFINGIAAPRLVICKLWLAVTDVESPVFTRHRLAELFRTSFICTIAAFSHPAFINIDFRPSGHIAVLFTGTSNAFKSEDPDTALNTEKQLHQRVNDLYLRARPRDLGIEYEETDRRFGTSPTLLISVHTKFTLPSTSWRSAHIQAAERVVRSTITSHAGGSNINSITLQGCEPVFHDYLYFTDSQDIRLYGSGMTVETEPIPNYVWSKRRLQHFAVYSAAIPHELQQVIKILSRRVQVDLTDCELR
jgi:hypothetical protein